jgi:hypothetical protein
MVFEVFFAGSGTWRGTDVLSLHPDIWDKSLDKKTGSRLKEPVSPKLP